MNEEAIRMWQDIEYERILREHEKKAKAAIIKVRTAEYVAEGVDKAMARIMAKAEFEAGL